MKKVLSIVIAIMMLLSIDTGLYVSAVGEENASTKVQSYNDLSNELKNQLSKYVTFDKNIGAPSEFEVCGEDNGYTICKIYGNGFCCMQNNYQVGDYKFYFSEYPNNTGIPFYVFNDEVLYNLTEAYEKGLINLDKVAGMLGGYSTKAQALLDKYVGNNNNEFRYYSLGAINGNTVLCQRYGGKSEKNSQVFGKYEVTNNLKYSPYGLGVYLVKDNVKTLEEAISSKVISIEDIAPLIEKNGKGLTIKSCTGTEPTKPVVVKKTTVSLAKYSANLYVKGSTVIRPTLKYPVGKTTYKSSNTKVARVYSNGKVVALKAGTARITVTNNRVSRVFTVRVNNPRLSRTAVSISIGKSYNLKIAGRIGTAKFYTTNRRVATVNSVGKITVNKNAKKNYSCHIIVKTNGVTLKCKVRVK